MKTLNAKKVMKSALVTAFSIITLALTACSKNGNTTSTPYGYGTYGSPYSGCTVAGCTGGGQAAAIGMIRSVALQADIGLQFIPSGTGMVQAQGTMVVGYGGASCPIPPGNYTVSGQLQAISGASAVGYLQISGAPGTAQAYVSTYLEQRTVVSQYLGQANYLMANTIQINGCGPAFYFQVQ